jgi:hypothetical protein
MNASESLPTTQLELERFMETADCIRDDVFSARERLYDLTGKMYEKCSTCGRISTLGQFFKPVLGGKECPYCQMERRKRRWWRTPALALLSLAFGLLVPSYFYIGVNTALALLVLYLMIIPHELSHAVVAWLLGGRIFEIRIGYGRTIWSRSIRGVIISLCQYPLMGMCVIMYPDRRFIRLRHFLVVSAGVLFSGLMILLFLLGARFDRVFTTVAFREVFIWVNAIVFIFNLLPRKINLGPIQLRTDGGSLLVLLKGDLTADELHLAMFTYGSTYALRRNDFDRAVEVCQEGLAEYPDNTLLKNNLGAALMEQGAAEESLALFRDLMAHYEVETEHEEPGIKHRAIFHALMKNNVAYATLLASSTADEMAQARDYARQAFRAVPWSPEIEGTWGSILVETGEVEEGIEHLLETLEICEEDRSRVAVLAFLAIGHHRLGKEEQAGECLAEAQALMSDHYVVQRAEAELERCVAPGMTDLPAAVAC